VRNFNCTLFIEFILFRFNYFIYVLILSASSFFGYEGTLTNLEVVTTTLSHYRASL